MVARQINVLGMLIVQVCQLNPYLGLGSWSAGYSCDTATKKGACWRVFMAQSGRTLFVHSLAYLTLLPSNVRLAGSICRQRRNRKVQAALAGR
jgi:hypothetical protein